MVQIRSYIIIRYTCLDTNVFCNFKNKNKLLITKSILSKHL